MLAELRARRNIRWLAGDVEGAVQLLQHAVRSGSRRAPEPLAWAYWRLAQLEFHRGQFAAAATACNEALNVLPKSAAALLIRARIAAASGKLEAALDDFRAAAEAAPLPEYRWALADALRSTNRRAEAEAVEARLEASGASDDPRTFAVYLATRNKRLDEASKLVERELEGRRDAGTLDALAFIRFRQQKKDEARTSIERALATRLANRESCFTVR